MARRERPGLAALLDAAGADGPPTPFHLGFLLGPRINAGGRIGDSTLGTRLLLSGDRGEAAGIAATLDRLNRERRSIEVAAADEALYSAKQNGRNRVALCTRRAPASPAGLTSDVRLPSSS